MSSRDWESLIHRHLDGVATSEEVAELSERLESDAETRLMYLRLARIHATLSADDFDEPSIQESENRFSDLMEQFEALDKRRRFHRFVASVAAVAAVITLMAGLYIFRPRIEPRIATISSINGAIRWTGAGGQVYDNVEPGRELTGGTLESLSVDSSAAFEFRDGSAITIFGLSVLIISDDGQKELHLRKGNLSATVEPQPQAKPLRLLTPAAVLEVLGTQFDVTADANQTKVTVNKGLVRTTRLTDDKSVDVEAAHSVVVTIEARKTLAATPLEKPTRVWKANLLKDKGQGKWVSAGQALRMEIGRAVEAGKITREQIREVYGERLANLREDEGFLRAIPRRTGREDVRVNYRVSLNVPHRQEGPILLAEGGRFRIQGRVKTSGEVMFGLGAANRDRSISGRFMASRQVESDFDIEIRVAEFQQRRRGDDAVSAVGLEVFAWFCFATEPGLEITHVELLAP